MELRDTFERVSIICASRSPTGAISGVYQTGVEMEALTAVSVAALTIYDMCKAADKEMSISGIVLVEKRGGKSGEFSRKD